MTDQRWLSDLPLKSPMVHRCFVVVSLLLAPAGVGAQDTITADEAVQSALSHPSLTSRLEARVARARASVEEVTVYPTPELSLEYEDIPVDIEARELTAGIEQKLDLSGWRSGLRDTLPYRASAARAEAEVWNLDVAALVRQAFYHVRYRQERVAAVESWIEHLTTGLASVEARVKAGDASGYDKRRLERELEIARARRATEASALAQAWSDLERWTVWDTRPSLTGSLLPEAPGEIAADPSTLPSVARLTQEELALEAETDAWGSPFWRDWSVGAGYRYVEEGPTVGHGFLVTLAIPLPLWNVDEPKLDRLAAERAELRSEIDLRTILATRRNNASRRRLTDTLEALEQLPSADEDAGLSRMAEIAYGAGEASLTELLDAFASQTTLQLARLDLQWEARLAAIAFERSLGLGVPR